MVKIRQSGEHIFTVNMDANPRGHLAMPSGNQGLTSCLLYLPLDLFTLQQAPLGIKWSFNLTTTPTPSWSIFSCYIFHCVFDAIKFCLYWSGQHKWRQKLTMKDSEVYHTAQLDLWSHKNFFYISAC